MSKLLVIYSLLSAFIVLGSPLVDSGHSLVRNLDEHLIFAFEVVRHGARAPLDDKKVSAFTVGEG